MSISIKKEIVVDLIQSKLGLIDKEIDRILGKWKYDNIEPFLKAASKGEIREAEDDAIDLTNLSDDRKKLLLLLKSGTDL